MKRRHLTLCCIVLLISQFQVYSQCIEIPPGTGEWQSMSGGPCSSAIPTPVPFLRITPDARSGGMGQAGVALTPTTSNMHFNTAALAQNFADAAISLNFSPYPSLSDGSNYYGYISGYKSIGTRHTVATSIRYFHWGQVPQFGNLNQLEIAIGYAVSITDRFSLGINGKYISSNPENKSTTGGLDLSTGRTGAMDISFFYILPLNQSELNFGLTLSNLGAKIGYTEEFQDYLPANFAFGAAWEIAWNEDNQLVLTSDLNKLMVPRPPHESIDDSPQNGISDFREQPVLSSIINSWSDASDGFFGEFKEFSISMGAEYTYNRTYTLRTGYFHENAILGNRQHFTMGLGYRIGSYALDASFLVSTSKRVFQQKTGVPSVFRISLNIDLLN